MYSVQKKSFESLVFFLLSPFLTVFIQIFHIAKGSRFALKLFIIIMGLIGYIYVPTWTNDKTRYLERYEEVKFFELWQFIEYLIISKRPDFIYESLIYLFGYLSMNIQILFFIVNTFCIYTIFKVADLITNYFKSNKRFLCFLLILFSFALQHLYSGIRFTFATCIFLWAIYFIEYKKQNKKGVLLFVITSLTHFSLLVFVFAFIIYKGSIKLNIKINFKYAFVVSLVFIFIPKEFLAQYFSSLEIADGYANKVDAYVNGDDFLTHNFENNFNSIIVYYVRNFWIYLAYFILLVQKDYKEKLIQLIFLFVAFLNVFYAFPTVFSRYLILIKFLFTIYLIFNYLKMNKSAMFKIFLVLYFLTFAVDCYILRLNWIATFKHDSIISLYTILTRDVGLENIIDNR